MKAIVFAGQGCQRKGMGIDAVAASSSAARLWTAAENRLRCKTGISLSEVIRDNPPYLHMMENALNPAASRLTDPDPNLPESHPKPHRIQNPAGVLSATYLTQPAVLVAQMALFEWMKEQHRDLMSNANVFAGHSLGEFTALAAMNVFPVDVAAELTFRRGVWMEQSILLGAAKRPEWMMYAVNPSRAKLDLTLEQGVTVSGEDVLAHLVEIISAKLRNTTSWVEIVNYNVPGEQIVVAGDEVALSILGKCIDPLFRSNITLLEKVTDLSTLVSAAARDTQRDIESGANDNPNAPPPKDFVPASWHAFDRRSIFQRRQLTQDDGQTLPLERLTHLTLERDGKSGLKKKSWYVPLPVDVPFHSSHLRRAMDNFHQDCIDALPSDELLAKAFEGKHWVCNLTGTVFNPKSDDFLDLFSDCVRSQNIGERSHSGKYASTEVTRSFLEIAGFGKTSEEKKQVSPRKLLAATMAAQLAHSVQWIDSMQTIVDQLHCSTVVEISPTRTLAQMFKKMNSGPGGGAFTAAEHLAASGLNIVSLPTESASV